MSDQARLEYNRRLRFDQFTPGRDGIASCRKKYNEILSDKIKLEEVPAGYVVDPQRTLLLFLLAHPIPANAPVAVKVRFSLSVYFP